MSTDAARASAPPRADGGRRPSFVQVQQLSDLLAQARRYPRGLTRADLCDALTMGRNAVDRRIRTAVSLNLLRAAGRGASTGGRAPEMWRFNPAAGTILTLAISYRRSTVALLDLDGSTVEQRTWEEGLLHPPEAICAQALKHLEDLARIRPDLPRPWGLGVSLPVPVDFRDGTLVPPATSPASHRSGQDSWTSFPLRSRLARRLGLATWVDDEVNVMALCAASRLGAPADLLYVRLSLGLGMGIVSRGKVHRGAGAASGEIAHIQMAGGSGAKCRCGRHGCLETLISGGAMEVAASRPQALRSSPFLREERERHGTVYEDTVFLGAARGDRVCVRILTETAERLSTVLAVLCTTYNPGEIVLGGAVVQSGQFFAQLVDQAVRRRVLPVTSERLRVRMGHSDDVAVGLGRLVSNQLLSPHVMQAWLAHGSPTGVPELVTHRRQDA